MTARAKWRRHNSIKERDPDSLLLYQVGDFFELYGGHDGEDANKAASVLNLTLTTRTIPDIGRLPMCGFPVHKLDDCVERLTGAGFDVNVARVKGNRHEVQHIQAQAAEAEVTELQYEIRDIPYDTSNMVAPDSVEVHVTVEYLLWVYLLGIILCTVAVTLASLPIVKMKPKNILSQMS